MATDETIRYGDLCRLCATKTNMVLAINIFEEEGVLRQLTKKIQTCLPIQVHESDELPKMICESCLYKLELFFDFRERSLRTENVLLSLFKDISACKMANPQQIIKLMQPIDVNDMVHSEMIMAHQNQQLLNEPTIPSEIDISQLHQRDIIVEHEIILCHQNVDMTGHSLANITLNHHTITEQDLSNQDGILVDGSNAIRYGGENLQLMQQEQQLLAEQYRLQSVNMTDADRVCEDIIVDASPCNPITESELIKEEHIIKSEEVAESKLMYKQEKHLRQDTGLSENCIPEENQVHSNNQFIDDRIISSNRSDTYMQSVISHDSSSSSSNSSICMKTNSSEVDLLHCNMCGKSFKEKMDFQAHYEEHFNKCSLCLAVFTNKDALNAHRKEIHKSNIEEVKPSKTRLKRAALPMKKELTKVESNSDSEGGNLDHFEEEEEEDDEPDVNIVESPNLKRRKWTPKECKECGKLYKTNYKLAEHMRTHTGEKPYKCNSCEKAFRSKIGLAQHAAKHTGQYELSCPTCGKGFQCKSYLMVHQRVHSDIKPYPCTTCGRNFKTKQSLLDHTNRHLGVKPYMCDTCGRGFITKGLCKAHQKVHTGLDNRKYSCKICTKLFVSKSYLQTHLRIHTGEKPFMCEVCGKGFLTRVDLRIHSTMHTGEKSYVCEMCGKAFARRDALRCHRRSHTGERPYSCDQCGQTFTQFSPMAIHKRLHTGERPYACEVCGKAFVSRSTMMSHWKKHVR